ncbi:acyl-CoA thioesterase [Elizabethkingia argentiflava]|uniref:Acyl-CoA thioesterase n=1 Tax=Elizabethkingia argenteiflava TaxID=2681556 RepID=A0A845PTY3_9FLAO|nr:acyl-CoA thioesterase [Elizabethkingia argenteiflava]NAW51689.1 acyl-CoA thioesterase [Elizabethkingia argenteiflava]
MEGEITSQVKIRFSDCDPIGHLSNSKYLEYMLNAREDHFEEICGYSYEDHIRQTGNTWVVTQNQITYLKEVRPNITVNISSKIIQHDEYTSVVEILMKDARNEIIHSVLWTTVVYFNMKERRVIPCSPETLASFESNCKEISEKHFGHRTESLRKQNKQWKKY